MITHLIAITIVLGISFAAAGEVLEFENDARALWFQAVGGQENITTIGFTEYPFNTTITDHYDHVGVNFEGLNFVTLDAPSFHDDWGIRMFSGNHLYFDEPINWIAADILGTMIIELYDGDKLFHTSQAFGPGADEIRFGGVVSDRSFDHVRIFDPADPLVVIDDLHFGPIIAVPAPGALAPLVLLPLARGRRGRS